MPDPRLSTKPPNPVIRRLGHWLMRAAVRLMVKIEARGLPPWTGDRRGPIGPLLVAYNHISLLDPPLVFAHLPRPAEALAAADLWAAGSIRWALNLYRPIPVLRNDFDRAALARTLAVLKAGAVVMVAPEARISLTGSLEYGRPGVAYLATHSGAPVLPVGITGSEHFRQCWRHLRRVPVTLTFGPLLNLAPLPPGVRGEARRAHLEAAHEQIMRALAALLPPAYRGVWK